MATFTAWKFDTAEGAEKADRTLRQAASEGLVTIEDHAVLSWPAGADRPSVKHEHDDDWRAGGWGAFLGLLIGALFFLPLAGAVAGAAIGLLNKRAQGVGLTKEQLDDIGQQVVPGTSALFVVTTDGDLDRVAERFRGHDPDLIATNLVGAEVTELKEAFDDD